MLAQYKKKLLVFKEVSSDLLTPIDAFQNLTQPGDESVLLESTEKGKELGRTSLIGLNPLVKFQAKGSHSEIRCGDKIERDTRPPLEVLKELHARMGSKAIGFIAYDAVRLFEKIPDRHPDELQLPDLYFLFHEISLTFHHFKGTLIISVLTDVSDSPEQDYATALQKIEMTLQQARRAKIPSKIKSEGKCEVQADIEDQEYCKLVERAQKYIVAGDAFQIVPSRSFTVRHTVSPLDIYRSMRLVTPAPFMYFINGKDFAVAGASPERLVSVKDGIVETMPIAGSRPNKEGMEAELLADEKEISEHMMLVDLGRNDLGRVCEAGSVAVKEFKVIHSFSHVIHLVSKVQGKLKKGCHALDALRAVFPAGTLSGAPKIRAMEIIDELETSRRGLYGGAICLLDEKGDLDSCIAIRTAFFKDGIATLRAGGGVVYDSIPQNEADETRHKARGVLEAIRIAEEGAAP